MNKKIIIFLLLIIFFAIPKTFSTEPLPPPVYFNEYLIEHGENVSIDSQTRTIHLKPIDGFSNSEYITHAQVSMNHQIINHTANDIQTRLAMIFQVPMLEQYITQFRFMKDDMELSFKMYGDDLGYNFNNFLYQQNSVLTFDDIFEASNEIILDVEQPYAYYYSNWVYFVFDVTLSSGINDISHSSILPLRNNQMYYGESVAFYMEFHYGEKFMDRSDIVIDVMYEPSLRYYVIHSHQPYESIENGYRFTVQKDSSINVTLNTTGNAFQAIQPLMFIMMGIVAVIIGITVAPIVIILIVNKNKK